MHNLKLYTAQITGRARRELKIKPKGSPYNKPWVHTTKGCKVFRIGTDEIVVTDGSNGYTPFRLSALTDILKQAKRLPITSEFKIR